MTPLLKTLLIIGGGLVAWNIFSRGAAAYSLNFAPGKITSFDWNGIRPVIGLSLDVQNTSNHEFNVLSVGGNVYTTSGGKEYLIGQVTDFAPTKVSPISQSEIPVTLSLELTGIVSYLVNAFQNSIAPQNIKLAAFANVDQLQVPLNFSYKLG